MLPYRLLSVAFFAAALGYVLISYLSFEMPKTLADAEFCGFDIDDFDASGQLAYPPFDAWRISFLRLQEYWVALSVGMSAAFMAFALFVGYRARQGALAAGAAAGGGILAFAVLCVSCLAPALSAVGLGVMGTVMADVPRWLMALNTLLLTSWGVMFLSRRLAACPIPRCLGATPAA
ncbi:hypothetical protein [Telmatospirillum sp. J64-1]|uniref:hypothetical protein n=1 Tax=Telmatospirillum sp. J64-1 TaxID=2502183 RepID=UPI001C8F5886|nr:hypothetical protein [Telmatospirillum sp. J64-1]